MFKKYIETQNNVQKTRKVRDAQATLEFVAVFLILIIMLFFLIELALYWKARYATETVTNDIIANAQLAPLPTNDFSCPAAQRALEILILRGGLFLLDSHIFTTVQEDKHYTFTSTDKVSDEPKLVLVVDCSGIKNNNLQASLKYRYRGIMLYTRGIDIFSSSNFSSQKY